MFRHLLALSASALFLCTPARADVVSISAMGFEGSFPATTGIDPPSQVNGVMKPDGPTLMFAPVDFPAAGLICRLTLVYDDVNAGQKITARLIRKRIITGSSTFDPPLIMATVDSTGLAGTMQKASTRAVVPRTINEVSNFYYVEVTAENFNTSLVGVQIEYKPTCP